jgi:hypothetical protein
MAIYINNAIVSYYQGLSEISMIYTTNNDW